MIIIFSTVSSYGCRSRTSLGTVWDQSQVSQLFFDKGLRGFDYSTVTCGFGNRTSVARWRRSGMKTGEQQSRRPQRGQAALFNEDFIKGHGTDSRSWCEPRHFLKAYKVPVTGFFKTPHVLKSTLSFIFMNEPQSSITSVTNEVHSSVLLKLIDYLLLPHSND